MNHWRVVDLEKWSFQIIEKIKYRSPFNLTSLVYSLVKKTRL